MKHKRSVDSVSIRDTSVYVNDRLVATFNDKHDAGLYARGIAWCANQYVPDGPADGVAVEHERSRA